MCDLKISTAMLEISRIGVKSCLPTHATSALIGLQQWLKKHCVSIRLYFVASEVNVTDLHFAELSGALDHDGHEVHTFQVTDDAPNDPQGRDIEAFFQLLQRSS